MKKSNLPQKMCPACGHAFSWRKKWEMDWDKVRDCSDRCRGARKSAGLQSGLTNAANSPLLLQIIATDTTSERIKE
jgi:hypothetical protein